MDKDTEDYIRQLEKRLVLLEGRVAMLEAQLANMRVIPTIRDYLPYQPPNIGTPPRMCAKCGMKLEGVMGYVCNDSYCPTFPKVSYTTQGTPNYGAVWGTQKLEAHLNTNDLKAYSPISRGDIDL